MALELQSTLKDYASKVSPLRILNTVIKLAKYHRIQSSSELLEACKQVVEDLAASGLDVKLHVYRGVEGLHEEHGFYEPLGWRIRGLEAYVEERGAWKLIASASQNLLYSPAHNPRGVFEGRVCLWSKYSRIPSDCDGVIVLSHDYWRALWSGAHGVIMTHRGPGVRYYGIFPPAFTRVRLVPALSLEYGKAMDIDGLRVKIVSDTEFHEPVTPIVRISVGDSSPRVLIVAHICHPKPGAHDNASGVAVAVEVARLLASSKLNGGVDILLVPEHTGTSMALWKKVVNPSTVIAGVSLDMVGANLSITGGSLLLVHSLYTLPSPLDPLLHRALYLTVADTTVFRGATRYPSTPFNVTPYTYGSDHDILLSYSIPASLVNEWPDKYYHTSLDTPDKLSPERLALIAIAVASTAKILLDRVDNAVSLMEEWYKSITLIEPWHEATEVVKRLVSRGLERSTERTKMVVKGVYEYKPYTRVRGILHPVWLYYKGGSEGARIALMRDNHPYTGTLPVAIAATGSVKEAVEETMIIHGVKLDNELVEDVVRIIGAQGE